MGAVSRPPPEAGAVSRGSPRAQGGDPLSLLSPLSPLSSSSSRSMRRTVRDSVSGSHLGGVNKELGGARTPRYPIIPPTAPPLSHDPP